MQNESTALPTAQHELESEMKGLRKELLAGIFGDDVSDVVFERGGRRKRNVFTDLSRKSMTNWRSAEQQLEDIEEEYETDQDIVLTSEIDIAGNLRKERTKMCHGKRQASEIRFIFIQ